MSAMSLVSIFSEGAATEVCALSEFFAAHGPVLTDEELRWIFRAFADHRPARCGGGAAAVFLVKLYEPGDEDITWSDLTCPDFDLHEGGMGCRTCGKQPL